MESKDHHRFPPTSHLHLNDDDDDDDDDHHHRQHLSHPQHDRRQPIITAMTKRQLIPQTTTR